MATEAVLVDVTSAAREILAAHDFGMVVETRFSFADATRKLEAMTGKTFIDCVPWRSPNKFNAKKVLEYTCSFDVVVRRKFTENQQEIASGKIDPAEINRLLKLMQDVDEFFLTDATAKELTLSAGGWNARIQATDKKQDYSRLHLYTNGQFSGWNRVTYLAAKEF